MKPPAPLHIHEVPPRKDDRRLDLISDALPFGRLWYEQALDAIRQTVSARSSGALWFVIDLASLK